MATLIIHGVLRRGGSLALSKAPSHLNVMVMSAHVRLLRTDTSRFPGNTPATSGKNEGGGSTSTNLRPVNEGFSLNHQSLEAFTPPL